jgi:hypothetical protein
VEADVVNCAESTGGWKVKCSILGGHPLSGGFDSFFATIGDIPFRADSIFLKGSSNLSRKLLSHIYALQKSSNGWKKLEKSQKKSMFETVSKFTGLAYSLGPDLIQKNFRSTWLPPVRETPKHEFLLNQGHFDREEYYGILARLEHSQAMIYEMFKEPMSKSIGDALAGLKSRSSDMTDHEQRDLGENLSFYLAKHLSEMGLAEMVYVKRNEDLGRLLARTSTGTEYNVAEASSGFVQVLPIVIESLVTRENYTYFGDGYLYDGASESLRFLEQPELHLHPKLQVKLIDFLVKAWGTYKVIETHSEHFVRRLQVLVADGKVHPNWIAIYAFDENDLGSKPRPMELGKDGFFTSKWPNGFFETASELVLELWKPRQKENEE